MNPFDAAPSVEVDELQALYSLTDRLYRAAAMDEVFEAGLDAITQTLDCTRASILLFDEDGVMRFKASRGLSEAYRRRLEGHTPWKRGEMYPSPIFVSDIEETDEADWVKATIRREGIRSLGFIPLTAEGGVVGKFMTYYPDRRDFSRHDRDLAVTIARQVGFSLERMRMEVMRRIAEDELRHSEARFRLMSENAPVMIWMSNPDGTCLHLNRKLRETWGVEESEVASFDWRSTMHEEDADMIVGVVTEAMIAQRDFSVEGRYSTRDGTFRVFTTTARPHFSAKGEFLGMIGVNVDVTEQREAAAQRELIFNELNHRVKNTLALVQAIAHQTLKGAEPSGVVEEFNGRLRSLAVAHNLLTKANWERAPLRQLVSDAIAAHGSVAGRFEISGPDVNLAPKQALAIAMALHELNTNAVKYGALSVDRGKVEVAWEVRDGDTLALNWREVGGPPVEPPAARGFGTLMIERVLASDLDGEVSMDFLPAGLHCAVRAPLVHSGL